MEASGREAVAACVLACAGAALVIARRRRRKSQRPTGVLFTGTGCSQALPLLRCAAYPSKECKACAVALCEGPSNPNWRGNVSLLIRFRGTDGDIKAIQIDVGKTFRESALRWYHTHGINGLDAVILTHDHADACFGLDDLRSVQRFNPATRRPATALKVFCDGRTAKTLRRVYPYLFPSSFEQVCQCCEADTSDSAAATPPDKTAINAAAAAASAAAPAAAPAPTSAAAPAAAPRVQRLVARLELACVKAREAFSVCGLRVHALPVQHGADYTSLGFGFGAPGRRIVYISDYTSLPPSTSATLSAWAAEGIALLVLDALNWSEPNAVHASVMESVALARALRPTRTLLVGMGHAIEHAAANAELRRLLRAERLDVQLASDGLFVPIELDAE